MKGRETKIEKTGYGLQEISLARIVKSRWQPRDTKFDAERLWELACSIREQGLINPVVVFPSQEGPEPHYELVAGERRVRAVGGLQYGGKWGIL